MHNAIVTQFGDEEVPTPKVFKDKYCSAFGFNYHTIDPMFQLSCYRGKTWDLLLKILIGDTKHGVDRSGKPLFKPPSSMANLQALANLEDVDRLSLLRLVVGGQMDLKQFSSRCRDLKALYTLRKEIIKELQEHDVTEWTQVEGNPRYKQLCDSTWLDSWLKEIHKQRFTRSFTLMGNMPSNFRSQIEDRIGANVSAVCHSASAHLAPPFPHS